MTIRSVCAALLSLGLLSALPGAPVKKRRARVTRSVERVQPQVPSKLPAEILAPELQAQRWLDSLSLRQKIAQLIVMPFYGENPRRGKDLERYVELVKDVQVGGLILLNKPVRGVIREADAVQTATFLNRMQKIAPIPLIVGGDFERGASMRVANLVRYPHAMALGAAHEPSLTFQLGANTAREARLLGVHWVFIPVADVNNNPDNPIINIRSFGEDPAEVATQVRAYIEGAKSVAGSPVLTSVKHFPGHGDTNVDSHLNMPRIASSRERMDRLELVPFRAAIADGVDSVMVAHLAVPAYEPQDLPATVSHNIVTGLLRDKLKFNGIAVTDAMDMKGLSVLFSAGEASVRAIEAGNDVLLIPKNAQEAVDAVEQAVQSGRIKMTQIDESVMKVLLAKARLDLEHHRFVPTAGLKARLNAAAGQQLAATIASKAITLLKNDTQVFPLTGAARQTACYIAFTERKGNTQGDAFLAEVKRRIPRATAVEVAAQTPAKVFDKFIAKDTCTSYAVATYVTFGGGRGTNLNPKLDAYMQRIIETKKPITLVSLGVPYSLRNYGVATTMLATFSTSPYSERAAAAALFGEATITGRSPVTIPATATVGQGIAYTPEAPKGRGVKKASAARSVAARKSL